MKISVHVLVVRFSAIEHSTVRNHSRHRREFLLLPT